MGTKRKSEEPEAITADKSITKKRKKKHHNKKNKENGASPHSKSSTDNSNSTDKAASSTSIQSRLAKLQRLTEELACTPESVREHLPEGGAQVVHAIAELGRTLACASLSSKQTDSSNPPSSSPPSSCSSNLLPPAPPIKDTTLETAVFTHPGTLGSGPTPPGKEVSYDRLEVLGDAYLELIATRLIWDQFKTLPAGRLSQARELLVKNETLAEYATKYGFDKRAKVPADYYSQPKRWLKTKGDIFEAYVAGVILSDPVRGFDQVKDWMTQLWLPKLREFQPVETQLNAKEELSRRVMSRGIKLQYVDEKPPVRKGGLQTFFIGVYLTGWGFTNQHLGSGTGLNKAIAGNEAAKQALANKPLIDEIHATKKAFDERNRLEREKAGT
ncbi:hypothetical protein VTO42DRAFT_4646 [Malbranchea cinnamomea]